MSKSGSFMRASQMQANLASFADFGPDTEQKILGLISPATLKRISDAAPDDWLAMELDVEVTEAVARVCGDGGVRAWGREALRKSLDGPVLGPILRSTLQLFGRNPGRLLSLLPRGFELYFRGAGTWDRVGRSSNELVLRWEDVPEVVAQSRPTLEGYAGAFEVFPELAGIESAVDVVVEQGPDGRWAATFHCRWGAGVHWEEEATADADDPAYGSNG